MRWYSDVVSSLPHGAFVIHARAFDLLDGAREWNCSQPPYGCGGGGSTWSWNDQLHMDLRLRWLESVAVSNGSHYGLFLFDALHSQTITSHYSLEKLLSNASFAVLLAQWMVTMVALAPADSTIGISAIANTRSFYLLPLVLLPRLKPALEAFWSSGCEFEGDQRALADAWFEIYPAIGEIVVLVFSLLNTLAKLLRRRASDALFGPTLLSFAFLHYFRAEIAASNWLEFDKRISTAITADEVAAASLFDFFSTDLAFRMNGKVESLYAIKLAILGLNLLPLAVFSRRASDAEYSEVGPLHIEVALAQRFGANAGLGSTRTPYAIATDDGKALTRLRPYELVRSGYVVVQSSSVSQGERSSVDTLLSLSDWCWLFIATLFRLISSSSLTMRVAVFDVVPLAHGGVTPVATPRLVTVTDDRLVDLIAWRLTAPPLQ